MVQKGLRELRELRSAQEGALSFKRKTHRQTQHSVSLFSLVTMVSVYSWVALAPATSPSLWAAYLQ